MKCRWDIKNEEFDTMNVLPWLPGSYLVFPLPCQSVSGIHHVDQFHTCSWLWGCRFPTGGGALSPDTGYYLMTCKIVHTAWYLQGQISPSVTFFYDTNTFYIWYKIFFLLSLFASSSKELTVSPYWSLPVLTLGENHCEDQGKRQVCFQVVKNIFGKHFCFSKTVVPTIVHASDFQIFSSVWVAFSHPMSVWIFMVLIPALPLAELQPCIQLHSIS